MTTTTVTPSREARVTAWQARKAVAAHRRGDHDGDPPNGDCRICRAELNQFVRYGVGLSESELRLLDGNRFVPEVDSAGFVDHPANARWDQG